MIMGRGAGILEGFSLQDQRNGGKGLQGGEDQAGQQASGRRGEHGVTKNGHDLSP